jgi:GNAT superfamily N-acetyltransferase
MKIPVRRACYEADTAELIEVLQVHLPYLPHDRIFEWLYRKNPFGEALVWVAVEPAGKRMIGVAAAFPRLMYNHGVEMPGYVLGDFCIDPAHRSLGLAVSLQRACLDEIAARDAFGFDFPSRSMLSVYQRLRIEANASMVRYAKPLRADRKVAQRVTVPFVAAGITTVANAALRLRERNVKRNAGLKIATEPGPWGEEFSRVAREWSPRMGVCVARTQEYLNWRYREHPLREYRMIVARREDLLRGYLVYHVHGEDCTIDDLLSVDNEISSALLGEAAAVARECRAQTLNSPWVTTHPGKDLLESCGFRRRESTPLVLMEFQQGAARVESDWFLTDGDRES